MLNSLLSMSLSVALIAGVIHIPNESQVTGVAKHISRIYRGKHELKARSYAPLIARKARQYDIEPGLLVSLVWHESNFDPRCVSSAGARGLGQVMPIHFRTRKIPRGRWHDPETNLDLACQIFSSYRKRVRHVYRGLSPGEIDHRTLVAYNMGPAVVSRGRFRSRYSQAVLRSAAR